jgi:hypothetical protein
MNYNLLLKYYDLQCQMFINGYIDFDTFTSLENRYYMRKDLFMICLN